MWILKTYHHTTYFDNLCGCHDTWHWMLNFLFSSKGGKILVSTKTRFLSFITSLCWTKLNSPNAQRRTINPRCHPDTFWNLNVLGRFHPPSTNSTIACLLDPHCLVNTPHTEYNTDSGLNLRSPGSSWDHQPLYRFCKAPENHRKHFRGVSTGRIGQTPKLTSSMWNWWRLPLRVFNAKLVMTHTFFWLAAQHQGSYLCQWNNTVHQ